MFGKQIGGDVVRKVFLKISKQIYRDKLWYRLQELRLLWFLHVPFVIEAGIKSEI